MSGRVTDDIEIDVIRSPSSRHHVENLPYVHKVGLPPKQKLLKEFTSTLKEIFFHDEPLRHFKDQPKSRKLVLGLQALFPILEWGRDYNLSKFKGDLISGLTIASLAIPQDIGYAKLANLDPQYALYSSFVTPLVYAFMGSSRDIAIGPVAVVSLLLGTLLQKEINPSNKVEYERLAFTATFFAGITQATLGVLRYPDFLLHDFYVESTAIGRTFAAIKDYELDGNKEMVALGTMNVIGSMTSCYVSTACFGNPGQAVIDKLYASGFPNLIGEDKIFLTVADAVLTFAPKTEEP
ncbi:hypothetical protein C3L33_21918, partial [Rhododendron williamsianum]